ncbi:MAG: hypothetical protein ORN29_06090 [Rhodoferax sp.]|nr:hypothetical protein [Rhodoferax sp.]
MTETIKSHLAFCVIFQRSGKAGIIKVAQYCLESTTLEWRLICCHYLHGESWYLEISTKPPRVKHKSTIYQTDCFNPVRLALACMQPRTDARGWWKLLCEAIAVHSLPGRWCRPLEGGGRRHAVRLGGGENFLRG